MSDEFVKLLRNPAFAADATDRKVMNEAADRIEELEANINTKADFIDATINQLAAFDQRIEELEAKQAKALEALRDLVAHTHDCEKQLTEDLHHADFCGESVPLTNARAALASITDTGEPT